MANKARRDELIARMGDLGPVAYVWIKNLQDDKCPLCGEDVKEEDFRDELSRKEFELSHMCQFCQDETFQPDDPLKAC